MSVNTENQYAARVAAILREAWYAGEDISQIHDDAWRLTHASIRPRVTGKPVLDGGRP